MTEDKIIIVHIFPDDKFFDVTANYYDSFEGLENRFFLYNKNRNYHFRYIKETNKVKVIHSVFAYIRELRRKDVDIVFFHGMVGRSFALASILRKRTKVIWWAWGYDLYSWRNYLSPIIPLELYKPLTKKYLDAENAERGKDLNCIWGNVVLRKLYSLIRKKAISRVNLLMPCIPVEYDLVKEFCPYFHGAFGVTPLPVVNNSSNYYKYPGNVLVGNSLTYENNHLDIFERLYDVELGPERQFIIPVSYGNAYGVPDNLIKMSHFREGDCKWLKDFMPIEEYETLFGTITHAVFGVVRQQALANIFACIRVGIKVYLYRDSVVAKQFRRDGYVFFTIEDDLNTKSLSECLSKEDAYHNYETYLNSLRKSNKDVVYKQIRLLVG